MDAENGEEMLYDLVGIKEDSSLTDALKRDGHGGLKILSANGEEYEDSIPNIGGEVKGNLQLFGVFMGEGGKDGTDGTYRTNGTAPAMGRQ